jgi:hypothetical protein
MSDHVRVPILRKALEDLLKAYCSQMSDQYDFPGRPWTPERDNDKAALQAQRALVITEKPFFSERLLKDPPP